MAVQPDLLCLSDLSQMDRIQILLQEYSTLRAEIIARTGYGFQLVAIGVVALTWLLKELYLFQSTAWKSSIVICFVTLIVVGTYIDIRDIKRAASRVVELEHEINSRSGERLLIWETQCGLLGRHGLLTSLFVTTVPLRREELQPLDSSFLLKEQKRQKDKYQRQK